MNTFEVEWTGGWPCLCIGEWIIRKHGVDVSKYIPEHLRCSSMNTTGTYSEWYFDENYLEVFEDYEDGLELPEWIVDNDNWISQICDTVEEKEELFEAIQSQDWRTGSCGGCI